jgi:uncharacterized protein YqjF (DUF2071 family)
VSAAFAVRPTGKTVSVKWDPVTPTVEQARSLDKRDHRPWPVSETRWLMGQTWIDLLFAHWPVKVDELRRHVPSPLQIDLYEGSAWIGITPFRLTGLRLRGTPPLPVLSSFQEVNVRTYVTYGGKSGIWFFSLDSSSRIAVAAARRFYSLPYFWAHIDLRGQSVIELELRRRRERARLNGSYWSSGSSSTAEVGSLEYFLTERYCLYSQRDSTLLRAEIHHRPWQLEPAEAELDHDDLLPKGVQVRNDEPLLHLSRRQDVVVWQPGPASAEGDLG